MTTTTLLTSLFKAKAWTNHGHFIELEKIDPEAQGPARHTALRLLNHIYVVDRIFVGHLTGVPHGYAATNTPETPTLHELRDAVAATDAWYVQYVETLPPERLAEPVRFTFTDGQHGCMTREEILAHVLTHGGYHRGAVGRIMVQAEVPPPRDLFTLYLHQSEPARRASA